MSDGAATRTLLVGGNSEIGLAILRRMLADGPVSAVLLGRDRERLEEAAASLRADGADPVSVAIVDALDTAAHQQAIADAFAQLHGVDVAVIAVGLLGAQSGLEADPSEAIEVMNVNFLGAGSLLLACLRQLRGQGRGTAVVLSTVAGERVRSSNAIYGAAKAGLDGLAQGLGDAAIADGVRVLTVRPGFVTTKMTAGLKPAPFSTTPEAVAEATVGALQSNVHTIWVPGQLRFVFALLRHMPRQIFRRLPL